MKYPPICARLLCEGKTYITNSFVSVSPIGALLQTRQDARIVLNLSFFKRALYHIKRVLYQRALYHRALLRTRQDARIPLHFWFFTRALYHVGLFCGSTKEPYEKRPMALYLSVADSTRYTNFFASFFFQNSPISYQNSPISQCSFADPYDAQISLRCEDVPSYAKEDTFADM